MREIERGDITTGTENEGKGGKDGLKQQFQNGVKQNLSGKLRGKKMKVKRPKSED